MGINVIIEKKNINLRIHQVKKNIMPLHLFIIKIAKQLYSFTIYQCMRHFYKCEDGLKKLFNIQIIKI